MTRHIHNLEVVWLQVNNQMLYPGTRFVSRSVDRFQWLVVSFEVKFDAIYVCIKPFTCQHEGERLFSLSRNTAVHIRSGCGSHSRPVSTALLVSAPTHNLNLGLASATSMMGVFLSK